MAACQRGALPRIRLNYHASPTGKDARHPDRDRSAPGLRWLDLVGAWISSHANGVMTFHIIYTPGTVRALLPFVDSLLEWSDLSFRLVSNGCAAEESAWLRARCEDERRLSFVDLKCRSMIEHGAVIDRLVAADRSEFFGFMDSDIIATGDFMSGILPVLDQASAVFSAWPITIRGEERVRPTDSIHTSGRHAWTADGTCIGGTYFAIYRREVLTRALAAEPLGFRRAFDGLLPRSTQMFLREIGEDRLFHDSARALHFRIIAQGGVLRVHDTSELLHIGNFSANIGYLNRNRPERFWKRIPKKTLRSLCRHVNGDAHRERIFQQLNDDPSQRRVIDRAWRISGYFSSLATALATGAEPPPILQLGDAEIDPRIVQGAQILETLNR